MFILLHITGYSVLGWSMHSPLLSADPRPSGHCRPMEPWLGHGHLHCIQCSGPHTEKHPGLERGVDTCQLPNTKLHKCSLFPYR